MKQKRLLTMFALLLVAATGAWATDYTTLAVGDVIKVGDTFSPTVDGAFNDFGVDIGKTYTLMRADIDNDYNVTEKTDGAYYVFKFVSIMSPYIHFEKAFAVTAISDGLVVTKIEDIKGMLSYTLTVHESAATTYSVTLAEGTEDSDKWTISPAKAAEGSPVTVTYSGEKKVKSVKAVKKVATIPVTSITLNKTATEIKVGSTETLSVTAVAPDNATDKTYTWKTSDASIATVDQDGKVTAVALGTVIIYAEANDGSGVKGSCTVTVSKVVTINLSDWGERGLSSFTKDGVTVSADMIDPMFGELGGTITISTTLGIFTKIVVTAEECYASGTGWSGDRSTMTWAGTPASTVSFRGEFVGWGSNPTTIVCTIVP